MVVGLQAGVSLLGNGQGGTTDLEIGTGIDMALEGEKTNEEGAARMPEPIARGVAATGAILSRRERWVPRPKGMFLISLPRIIPAAQALARASGTNPAVRRYVRDGITRILAYTRADHRLQIMMNIATRNPRALDDILLGEISPQVEPHRYNLMATLGIFSRNSLLHEVMAPERVRKVQEAFAAASDDEQ
jgi:hypothetical protein